MREKNGEITKNCRSCRQGLYLEINFADRVDGHIIIDIFASVSVLLHLRPCVCICVRASESVLLRLRPPVCVSVRASACTSVLLRVRPPACVSVRSFAGRDAKYSCVQCVGGKIVQTRPASGRTHKDLQGVLYICICKKLEL